MLNGLLAGGILGGGAGVTRLSELLSQSTLWLDASDTSTITDTAGAVSQWDDKSGNGNHATQATASEQVETGVNTLNGLNVMYYDGAGTGKGFYLPVSIVDGKDDLTVIMVSELLSANHTSSSGYMSILGDSDISIYLNALDDNLNIKMQRDSGDSPQYGQVANGALDAPQIIGYIARRGATTDFITSPFGLTSAPVASDNPLGGTELRLAVKYTSSPSMHQNLGEVLIFDRALSKVELNIICNYLKNKWGVAWTNV